jgi:hypothetical protein
MKTLLSLLILCALGSYKAQAQEAVSSKKNGQMQASSETTTASPNQPATATLVSGDRQPVVQEVPSEKENTATAPVSTVPVSSSKKPD